MKIKILINFCLLLPLFVAQLQGQSAVPDKGCVDLNVLFTPPPGSSTYFWNFGDSNTSTLENPGNIYSTPGSYNVTFSETNGGTVLWQTTINVYAKPQFELAASPLSGCSPLDVLFTPTLTIDPAIPINNLAWTFGDANGTTTNNAEPVSHVYNIEGVFDIGITLSTGFANCDITLLEEDFITASGPSNVGFTTDPSPPVTCTGPLTVTFTNTTPGAGNFDFLWTFDNGSTSSDINPPAQTYTADGVYTVVLQAEDASGCITSFSQIVRIGAPNAAFHPALDTICIGDIISMVNESEPGAYNWTFGTGAFPSTSVQTNPLVQFNEGGVIDITLTVSANGCSNMVMGSVYVEDPDASFTSNPTYTCTNEMTVVFTPTNQNAASYLWFFNDGTNSTQTNPTHTITNMDTTTYSMNGLILDSTYLIITTMTGCMDTFLLTDTIWQPNALFAPDVAQGCAPLSVTFEDQSTNDVDIVLWEWDYGDGTGSMNTMTTDPTHVYTDPGEYPVQLIVTDIMGCKDTSFFIVIEVGDVLMPDFTVDQTDVCPGDTVTFTPTNFPGIDLVDAWHYETDDARSFHCFQTDELKWAFVSETGTYDVTLYVEYNGCMSSITKSNLVTVKGPIAEIGYLIECDTPYSVNFTNNSHDATDVVWDFGDGTDTTLANLVYTYADTGTYKVYLTATNATSGCPPSVDSAIINIRDIKALVVPLDTLLCLGNMYSLNASPSEGVDDRCWRGYTWYFSDPNDRPITTADSLVDHVFESPGYNDVRLVTRDINGCLDTFDQRVKVFGVYPAFTFDDPDGSICLGQLINFTDLSMADTSISTYEWFFDDGMSDEKDPSHVFNLSSDPTQVTVTLSVTDSLGCNGMTTINIPLYEPTSTITALPSTAICLGDVIDFSATDFTSQGSSLTWDWDFGDMMTTSNLQNTSVEYMAEGIYTVTLNYEEIATGCEGEEQTLNISVQDYPMANFSTSVDGQSPLCYPQLIEFTNTSTSNSPPLTYLWSSNSGTPFDPTAPSPQITFNKGDFDVTLVVSTSNGCTDTHSESFTLEGPEGIVTPDQTSICTGDEITFTLSGLVDVDNWTWVLPNGQTQIGGDMATYVYDMPPPPGNMDTVRVELEGASSICTFTPFTTFSVAQTIADLSGIDPIYCLFDTLTYSTPVTPSNEVIWDFGNGQTSTTSFGKHIYATGGVYTINLSVSDTQVDDCVDMDSKEITVIDSVRVSPDDRAVCKGDVVVFAVEGVKDYHILTWTARGFDDSGAPKEIPNFDLSCRNCDTPTATINESITYTLNVRDTLGQENCYNKTYEFKFTVPDDSYKLPNAFTPSVNGTTNYFNVVADVQAGVSLEDLTITKFEIFNRWGQKVYDNDSPATGWDGMQNGKPAASDVYLYNIETSLEGCEGESFRGNVTVLR